MLFQILVVQNLQKSTVFFMENKETESNLLLNIEQRLFTTLKP